MSTSVLIKSEESHIERDHAQKEIRNVIDHHILNDARAGCLGGQVIQNCLQSILWHQTCYGAVEKEGEDGKVPEERHQIWVGKEFEIEQVWTESHNGG